jgi:hypothetical protein
MPRVLTATLLSGFLISSLPAYALDEAALSALTSACTGDAYRLCSTEALAAAAIGRYSAITGCFRVNRPSLTYECRVAIDRYARNPR